MIEWRPKLFVFVLAGLGSSAVGCGPKGRLRDEVSHAASPSTATVILREPPSATVESASAPVIERERPLPVDPVLEVRWSALGRVLSIYEDGAVKIAIEQLGGTPNSGAVSADKVEEVHVLLRQLAFCSLSPKARESSPGYIVVEARFADLTCSVELPDRRWDQSPRPKRALDALRALEAEACPSGCKR
ncbi:MAG: hypothetical protein U0271_48225 [Polyangiaceae bacterium]